MDPTVSVVIANYNYGRYLRECLGSIPPSCEVVVSDDGSTDDSVEIATSMGATVLRGEHAGPAAARNRGIRASHGRYVAFLDADDILTPHSVDARAAVLRAGFGAVCGAMEEFGDGEALRTKFFQLSTVMVSRDLLDRYGLFDERLQHREDKELWLRLFGRGYHDTTKATCCYLAMPLALYRVHDASTTARWNRYSPAEKQHHNEIFREICRDY